MHSFTYNKMAKTEIEYYTFFSRYKQKLHFQNNFFFIYPFSDLEVFDKIRTHLAYLPFELLVKKTVKVIIERTRGTIFYSYKINDK